MKYSSLLPKIWLRINRVSFGKKIYLGGWPIIFRFPKANLKIGSNCSINSSLLSNLIGLYQRTIIVARGEGKITIGNFVGISGSTIYARDKIEIGDHSLIGANCKIIDNDFHAVEPQERRTGNISKLKTRPVKIGENVFIGCNTIILKGTVLGDNCVVGAGSVVHGTFDANTLIAGNPAKVIKRINE